jgi:hypothetical protein
MKKRILFAAAAAVCCLLLSCALPRLFWPQSDAGSHELVYGSGEHSLLIAAISTEFKDAVVETIIMSLDDESIAIKTVGLHRLKYEDPGDFDAVVIINACIAWGMDPQVDGYVDKYGDAGNIIVLTTSGDGDWRPGSHGRAFDAIASASDMARVDAVAGEIVEKVKALLTN